MEWLRVVAALSSGVVTAGLLIWVISLYERIARMKEQIQAADEVSELHAQESKRLFDALCDARHIMEAESMRRSRVEHELSRTRESVARIGWSKTWN